MLKSFFLFSAVVKYVGSKCSRRKSDKQKKHNFEKIQVEKSTWSGKYLGNRSKLRGKRRKEYDCTKLKLFLKVGNVSKCSREYQIWIKKPLFGMMFWTNGAMNGLDDLSSYRFRCANDDGLLWKWSWPAEIRRTG